MIGHTQENVIKANKLDTGSTDGSTPGSSDKYSLAGLFPVVEEKFKYSKPVDSRNSRI
jgi:hypothetical protein